MRCAKDCYNEVWTTADDSPLPETYAIENITVTMNLIMSLELQYMYIACSAPLVLLPDVTRAAAFFKVGEPFIVNTVGTLNSSLFAWTQDTTNKHKIAHSL